jgi:hypothetical protein
MKKFAATTWFILADPLAFFESVRGEGWWQPYRYFLVVALVLSILSPAAWALGVDGGTPLSTSTTAQRDVYRWWHDGLSPRMGSASLPLAMLALCLEMHIVLAVFALILHVVFRLLRGRGPLLNAWKSISYGIAPALAFGFLPYVGLLVGVYATVLQLSVAPSVMYRVRDGRAYALLAVVLAISIAAFWSGFAI